MIIKRISSDIEATAIEIATRPNLPVISPHTRGLAVSRQRVTETDLTYDGSRPSLCETYGVVVWGLFLAGMGLFIILAGQGVL